MSSVVAGAKEDQIDLVAKTISDERNVNVNRAKAVVDSLNKKNSPMTTNNDNNNISLASRFCSIVYYAYSKICGSKREYRRSHL